MLLAVVANTNAPSTSGVKQSISDKKYRRYFVHSYVPGTRYVVPEYFGMYGTLVRSADTACVFRGPALRILPGSQYFGLRCCGYSPVLTIVLVKVLWGCLLRVLHVLVDC